MNLLPSATNGIKMTPTEKLERIKAKCQQLLASDFRPDTSLPGGLPSVTHALAQSTIAAIDSLNDMGEHDSDVLGANIIAAWPEELL